MWWIDVLRFFFIGVLIIILYSIKYKVIFGDNYVYLNENKFLMLNMLGGGIWGE